MSTTYREAGDLIKALADKVMQQSHPELVKDHVTISTIIASRESEEEGDMVALRLHGLPVAAKTSITSLADRARGIADAKLMIDNYAWSRLSDARKLALLDHELEHLALRTIKPTKKNHYASGTKFDDLGRPCLKIRPHDWEITGFQAVAERHGDSSIEAMQFAAFRDEHGQLNMFGPSVLQIAEKASNGNELPPFSKALKKQLDNADLGSGVKISDGEGNVLHDSTIDLSTACAGRHHSRCKYEKCQCDCGHPNRKEAEANG